MLLTRFIDERRLIEGLKSGADDFVTKPFRPAELEARFRAGIRVIELEERLLQVQHHVQQRALFAALTGASPRQSILDTLVTEFERAQRTKTRLSVIYLDLDLFKQINDTHSHRAGDEVLKETAQRIQATLRTYDSFGRLGGEEFLLISPGYGLERERVVARAPSSRHRG